MANRELFLAAIFHLVHGGMVYFSLNITDLFLILEFTFVDRKILRLSTDILNYVCHYSIHLLILFTLQSTNKVGRC